MQLTWKKLAAIIAQMSPDQQRKPVHCEANGGLIYGVVCEDFETDFGVPYEIAVGDKILKITN